MPPKKIRADLLLLERGLCRDADEARKLIIAGLLRVGADHIVTNASILLPLDAELQLETPSPFVSRGAYKLIPALEKHACKLDGLVALDIGSSTGGFTDAMLQRGAKRVYAVDSGRGQLHGKLRADPRVVSLEKTNARHLRPGLLPELADILTMDVSFISVTKILPALPPLLTPNALAFILVKPQFEARREEVGEGGVVRSETVRQACVDRVVTFAQNTLAWHPLGVYPCEITGPKGNQEFMSVFQTG